MEPSSRNSSAFFCIKLINKSIETYSIFGLIANHHPTSNGCPVDIAITITEIIGFREACRSFFYFPIEWPHSFSNLATQSYRCFVLSYIKRFWFDCEPKHFDTMHNKARVITLLTSVITLGAKRVISRASPCNNRIECNVIFTAQSSSPVITEFFTAQSSWA
jgi:hypothetical protein